MGCAYEAQPSAELRPYVRLAQPSGCGVEPTVCPGYTTSLPEVIEVSRARLHWSKGSLRDFTRTRPTKALLHGIEILEGASNECQLWAMENPVKKQGA